MNDIYDACINQQKLTSIDWVLCATFTTVCIPNPDDRFAFWTIFPKLCSTFWTEVIGSSISLAFRTFHLASTVLALLILQYFNFVVCLLNAVGGEDLEKFKNSSMKISTRQFEER